MVMRSQATDGEVRPNARENGQISCSPTVGSRSSRQNQRVGQMQLNFLCQPTLGALFNEERHRNAREMLFRARHQ